MASENLCTEVPEPLSGKFVGSFAYITIKDRLPVILTKAIDSLYRERNAISATYGEAAKEETKTIIGRLSKLQNEMVTNKLIVPLTSNGLDVGLWNEYLEKQEDLYEFQPSWFDSPWLYIECYLYRRMKEAFELSSMLQEIDPFKNQKESSFLSSLSAANSLSIALQHAITDVSSNENETVIFDHFVKFVEISLWGNKCDLSISAGEENIQSTSPMAQLNSLRANIIVNETKTLWNMLQLANQIHPKKVRLDIILDNAGFELFTDLCLLEFLGAANLVQEVHLYVKLMPWFVSDTLAVDITWLLTNLSNSNEKTLANFGRQWTNNVESKRWIVEKELFWTLPHDFSEMEETDSSLYTKLSQSDLVIFKGDLNYRKLTSDRKWNETTPFVTSLRGFLPASLCTLRTIKADVVTGLEKGVKEKLDSISQNWMISCDYAVIQCASAD